MGHEHALACLGCLLQGMNEVRIKKLNCCLDVAPKRQLHHPSRPSFECGEKIKKLLIDVIWHFIHVRWAAQTLRPITLLMMLRNWEFVDGFEKFCTRFSHEDRSLIFAALDPIDRSTLHLHSIPLLRFSIATPIVIFSASTALDLLSYFCPFMPFRSQFCLREFCEEAFSWSSPEDCCNGTILNVVDFSY